jgi:tripartite-type tricarboxylate transporter receptor subunit TctC
MTQTDRSKRSFILASLAPLAGLHPVGRTALAQDTYPTRPIRFVVGTPPGTGTDNSARLVATKLSEILKQPIIVENKAGAHGAIACSAVKAAAKDGYTLLYGAGGTMAINIALYGKKLPFDTLSDFEPVVGVQKSHLYLAVNKDLPITNLKEMVAYVKARPGKLYYGTGGNGTTSHLAMEMLKRAAGIYLTHVPYRGSTLALQDMLGGHVQFAFDASSVMLPVAANGQVRLIALAAPERASITPAIQTLKEQGMREMDAMVWSGLFAPAGTPSLIVARLNEAINGLIKGGQFDESNKANASEPMGGTSKDFRVFVEKQIAYWTTVIRTTGIQPD